MTAPRKPKPRCCAECLSPMYAARQPGMNRKPRRSKFCSTLCKTTWNNRRKNRGADVYDLWMAMRYERDEAKRLGVWTEMCRLSELWNAEDEKAGRITYSPPAEVVLRLKDKGAIRHGEIVCYNAAGVRR